MVFRGFDKWRFWSLKLKPMDPIECDIMWHMMSQSCFLGTGPENCFVCVSNFLWQIRGLLQFLTKKVRFVKFSMTKLVFVPIFSYKAQVCSIFWQQNRGLFQFLATKIGFVPFFTTNLGFVPISCNKVQIC